MSLLLACLLQGAGLVPIHPVGGPWFGRDLVRVPDQDGDGLDELAVASVPLTGTGGRCSVVYVYSTGDFDVLETLRGSTCDARPLAAIAATPIWPKGALVVTNEDSGYEVLSLHDRRVCWRRLGTRPCFLNRSVAESLGDVDGDGVDDVAAVVRDANEALHVELLSGLSGIERWASPPWTGDNLTVRLAAAPDTDRDGTRELWVAVHSGGTTNGEARVELLGGRNGRPHFGTRLGIDQDGSLGDVTSIPDIDGDRVRDVAIGFWISGSSANPPSGWVDVLSGASGELLQRLTGRRGDAEFGTRLASSSSSACPTWTIAGHGDLWFDVRGGVSLFEAPAREPLAGFELPGRARGFGAALEYLPDIDGDGYEELAVTALEWEWGEADDGLVAFLDGRTLLVVRRLTPPAW